MRKLLLYSIGCTPACETARRELMQQGIPFTDHPSPEVTHLLLDTPSFRAPGILRCGVGIGEVLETLPENITVIGGMLKDPSLNTYMTLDLLDDDDYVAQNAAITADCALALAASRCPCVLRDTPTLVIGWGRIGKCLERRLQNLGCDVTVLARKPGDRAMLRALGTKALAPEQLAEALPAFRLILNTAPEAVITVGQSALCRNCVKIDLASSPGILGEDVITARGLPGLKAPGSSGHLISETVLRMLKEDPL